MLVRYLIFFLIFFLAPASLAKAKGINQCDVPSKDCLIWVDATINTVKPHSRYWYKLKLWQFDSLMTVKKFADLQQQLDSLEDHQNLPPVFTIYLKIYQAKLLVVVGERDQAKALITLTVDELRQLNQSFYSPIRVINIANLMLDLEQYEQTRQLLEQVAAEYKDSKDDYLKLELYGNLGHAYRLLSKFQQALDYYKMSLEHAKALGVEQQISILFTHVARMYNATQQFDLAQQHFEQALWHAEQDNQIPTITNAKIDLAYFYLQQNNLQNAQGLIKNIPADSVLLYQQKKWQALKQIE